jgi:hypothetical protein
MVRNDAMSNNTTDDNVAKPSPDPVRSLIHDLRNCLFTLSSGVRVLKKAPPDPALTAEVLRMLESNTEKAGNLLNELSVALKE